jgi:hypothetical protein
MVLLSFSLLAYCSLLLSFSLPISAGGVRRHHHHRRHHARREARIRIPDLHFMRERLAWVRRMNARHGGRW